MSTCLVTGFDPFGGQNVNPSRECVFALPDRIGPVEIGKLEIPTVFGKAAEKVLAEAERLRPDMIVMVGQAGGRVFVTPEKVAINLRDASLPDNAGNRPRGVPVVPGGPDAYFTTLPVHEALEKLQGLPVRLSLSAGSFVCNDVFYQVLHAMKPKNVPVGFVHIPFLPEQAGENTPCMEKEQALLCLTRYIGACAELLSLR